jgi:acetoacetyl-CoA reductase
MEYEMTDRIALVTGGVTGIGAATCKVLKAAGYKVAASYVANEDAAKKFEQGTGVKTYKWDVSDYAQCAKGVESICKDFGGTIDILVNNAGITRDGMMHKMAPESWNIVIATNLTSCFNMSRAVIGAMREKGFGRIINVTSVNGQMGQIGQTNYCASKAGIIGFTHALARESAPKGITVNAVSPGYTDTAMVSAVPQNILQALIAQIPVGRLGKPDEIADAILFLASEKSAFITGETLCVNGGHYMA